MIFIDKILNEERVQKHLQMRISNRTFLIFKTKREDT